MDIERSEITIRANGSWDYQSRSVITQLFGQKVSINVKDFTDLLLMAANVCYHRHEPGFCFMLKKKIVSLSTQKSKFTQIKYLQIQLFGILARVSLTTESCNE